MTGCGTCGEKLNRKSPMTCGSVECRCFKMGFFGYSPCWQVYIFTDAELSNPAIIRDGRNNAHERRVPYRGMLDYLTDLLRDFPGVFVDRRSGALVSIDMTPLEDAPVHWFRDLIRPCPIVVRPRVRIEARERWRVALTLLRATDPNGACWGAVNDNNPLIRPDAPEPRA